MSVLKDWNVDLEAGEITAVGGQIVEVAKVMVIRCSPCGNYPLATVGERAAVADAMGDITLFLERGCEFVLVDYDDAAKGKLLRCQCHVEVRDE